MFLILVVFVGFQYLMPKKPIPVPIPQAVTQEKTAQQTTVQSALNAPAKAVPAPAAERKGAGFVPVRQSKLAGKHFAATFSSLGAALATKEAMEKNGIGGTIRFYGCPAEETLEVDAFVILRHPLERELLVEALRRAEQLSDRHPMVTGALGAVLGRAGRADEARAVLKGLKEAAGRGFIPAHARAVVLAGLGEVAEACARLEEAHEEQLNWLVFLNLSPLFDGLRGDPAYASLIERTGLVPGN